MTQARTVSQSDSRPDTYYADCFCRSENPIGWCRTLIFGKLPCLATTINALLSLSLSYMHKTATLSINLSKCPNVPA